jgi:hypothetical protein
MQRQMPATRSKVLEGRATGKALAVSLDGGSRRHNCVEQSQGMSIMNHRESSGGAIVVVCDNLEIHKAY